MCFKQPAFIWYNLFVILERRFKSYLWIASKLVKGKYPQLLQMEIKKCAVRSG